MALDPTLLEQIRSNDPSLTDVDLSSANIDNTDATLLADALKNNHTLKELNLKDNAIRKAGATALADALKNNHTLIELDLTNNLITEAGATAISNALITSKNILYAQPGTTKLWRHCEENKGAALDIIERAQNDPDSLTIYDRKEIQERIPAIFYFGKEELGFSKEQILEILASIGIKPAPGLATQRINEAREAQRQAALEDPSQGI